MGHQSTTESFTHFRDKLRSTKRLPNEGLIVARERLRSTPKDNFILTKANLKTSPTRTCLLMARGKLKSTASKDEDDFVSVRNKLKSLNKNYTPLKPTSQIICAHNQFELARN